MAEPIAPQGAPASPAPDIMNDPRYATNAMDEDDMMGDADTCRICRGEGSDLEPLFHPCKCSGSIKHVHQDCLMEWLSHSQKKHCELCKTPFRFTKLYSPNMPQTLPIHVLTRHVVIHTFKNVATWLRFCLVITVWLACLPYVIRQVWRLLFWFSDGGWPPNYLQEDAIRSMNSSLADAQRMLNELRQFSDLSPLNGTSPSTPLMASQITPATTAGMIEKFNAYLASLSRTTNTSSSDPVTASIFNMFSYAFGIASPANPTSLEGHANSTAISNYLEELSPVSRKSSLLSEMSFFKNLTRSPLLNQLFITVAEGYVITILVVVCFILVFLIREWVVQQQPGINMGAGFNADFAAPDRQGDQQAVLDALPRIVAPAVAEDEFENPGERRGIRQRPIARPRRRNAQGPDIDPEPLLPLPEYVPGQVGEFPADLAGYAAQNRPTPVRDALSPAAEIQRRLTEEPRMTEEFLAIWRRADSDPKEVLRIIEREGKGEQMLYWVNAMKVLQNPRDRPSPSNLTRTTSSSIGGNISTARPHGLDVEEDSIDGSETRDDTDRKSQESESWVDLSQSQSQQLGTSGDESQYPGSTSNMKSSEEGTLDKGKGKADESQLENGPEFTLRNYMNRRQPTGGEPSNIPLTFSSSITSRSSITRPRAISDGPQLRESVSPLANNNWSFSHLPSDTDFSKQKNLANGENSKPVESADILSAQHILASEAPESREPGTQAWKAAQDLRVQQAIAKGREANNSALEDHTRPLEQSPDRQEEEIDGPVEIKSRDGSVKTYANWDEVFANNPVRGTASEDEEEVHSEHLEVHQFQPGTPLPEFQEPVVARPPEPQGLLGNVAEFMWGGVGDQRAQDEPGGNDVHIVQDIAEEPPFVPVAHLGPVVRVEEVDPERDVLEDAIAVDLDANDPDAIEDAEDFEGIMELVGMRGPLSSLVQNALFSAFLLALTVAFGIWIPYNIGRIFLLLLANPGPTFKLPLRLIFGCAAFLQDLTVSLFGIFSFLVIKSSSILLRGLSYWWPAPSTAVLEKGADLGLTALKLSHEATERVLNATISSLVHITDSEIFAFSASSHESLISLKTLVVDIVVISGSLLAYPFTGKYHATSQAVLTASSTTVKEGWSLFSSLPAYLTRPDTWVISLEVAERSAPLDLELSVWGGFDRFWAILAGYTALCLLGALYVRKGTPFSSSQVGREWEATIIDLLNQSGGVLKVILIISIEMLVFPLYCGLLLDAALLPLFENATIATRIAFTCRSPLTSIFVHWFVGTCYMFHFALFVSMCRKIMRKGVLYFIRDPDDPTFHPVRDVLERNVATQLRKILFSALVYGALVVICLGGVVWGLSFAFRGVLPIHWSSNEPVLEFPIDLLFYNFLMPLAVRFFKPSDGLHAMYSWWFRQCARMLRLTWFMFDERKIDEEGYSVRRSWMDVFRGIKGDPMHMMKTEDAMQPFIVNGELRAYYRQDGRYVRAPASDQVRIPKGTRIFLDVDEENNRLDDEWDRSEGIHGRDSTLFKQVYIPPWFRTRICAFILSIWLFAAVTGVCITIVPLVFGRLIFAKIIPNHVRKNDVYAFSIGVYLLGSTLYAILHFRQFFTYLRTSLAVSAETPHNVLRRAALTGSLVMRIAWTYTAFLFVLPTLFAFVVELYLIVPLHTYFAVAEPHVIHFVQSWTLGLLYVKLTTRIILWHEDSRPAQSLRAITRDGYLNPDAKLATRCFILPVGFVLGSALIVPWISARFATTTMLIDKPDMHVLAYRYAYPLCFAFCCIGYAAYILLGLVKEWRMLIRDEVYLIGERLHNFGDRKVAGASGVAVPSSRRIDT